MAERIHSWGQFASEIQSCASCQSENQKTFTSEIAIHFPGLEGLKNPIVWVFPRISVCLDCGMVAQFIVPERELEVLRTGAPVEGAVVLLGEP
jgi:hypothetical protein